MPVPYDPDPERFRGTGTVFIARDVGVGVWDYWDALPDGPPRALEPLPAGLGLREAATWGAERAARVLVRTETTGYFLVGSGVDLDPLDDEVEGGTVSLADLDRM